MKSTKEGAGVALGRVEGTTPSMENPSYTAARVARGPPTPSNKPPAPRSTGSDDGSSSYIYASPNSTSPSMVSCSSSGYSQLHSVFDGAYMDLKNRSFALVNLDKEVFVPTRCYQKAQDFLNQYQIVTIRGTPSSGKTAIGRSLLRHFATQDYAPLVLQTLQEWRQHVREDRKQIVLLDCSFGQIRVEKAWYLEWSVLFSTLSSVVKNNPNCKVVITTYTHIMAELESMTCPDSYFQHIPLVDLDDVALTSQEKEEMLTKHLSVHKLNLDSRAIHDVIERDVSGPAFPWCCANYVRDFSKNQYINLRYDHEVFSTPGVAYLNFFCAALQDSDNWTDLVPMLVLAMNNSGFVLGKDEHIEMKLRILGFVTIDVDLEELQTRAAVLKGSILSSDMKQFKTKALNDGFSFAVFKKHSVEMFMNACNVEFLVKHVHVEPTSSKTDIIIDNTSEYFPLLLKRFCHEILNGNMVQMSQHPAFQNDRFLADFEAFVLKKNCLKAVISAKDCRHNMPLIYWSAWMYAGTLTCWCLSKILSADDGRVVRRTFLACCLFGEKVNSRRMARMFKWLCEDQIMKDAISAITLPVPAAEDRLSEEVKAKCDKVLTGPTILTCGLSDNMSPVHTEGGQTDIERFFPARMNPVTNPGSPQIIDGASGVVTPPLRSADSTSPTSNPLGVTLVSQISQCSNSSLSTGTYISCRLPYELAKQANLRDSSDLSTISENDTEASGHFLNGIVPTEACIETDTVFSVGIKSRSSRFSSGFSTRSTSVSSDTEPHLQSGKPVPPSIVKETIEKEEGRVILEPICSRWYTFLRLVSMCEVDEVNLKGYTLLHTAAFHGEINVVQYLVESGADPIFLTQQGNTPLSKAVDRNQVRVASYLLKQGSQLLVRSPTVTSQDLSWMLGTPKLYNIFCKIVQKRRAQMLCLLFSYGIQLKDKAEMDSLLKEASCVGDNDAVVKLLKDNREWDEMEIEDDEVIYSVPTPPTKLESRRKAAGVSKQKHFKGPRHFFGF